MPLISLIRGECIKRQREGDRKAGRQEGRERDGKML